ncbi:PREDICTED: uncharacterized protein LOC104714986 [Camelina sativa]|uniref:Uncharacterized protein LOC104714986 n=1 Tax=Camelina sativa TaxID=90675 RepID=A0ABM0TSU0_CAMSA|nr:PREDICTED: uncharacterized protein LOC104714986 [Camelina sativa]
MAAANKENAVSDDLNYEEWAPTVKKRLVQSGLWNVVANGVPPDPKEFPELSETMKVEELAQWRNCAIKDQKALKILQSSLPDSVFRKTFSVASAKDLWDMLRISNDEAKSPKLEKTFKDLTMYDGEPMDLYLNRVMDIVDEVRRWGNPKSDDEVITKLLTTLAWPYDEAFPVVDEIMSLPDMTLEDLISVLEMFGDRPVEYTITELKKFYTSLKKEKSEQMWCCLCKKYDHNQQDCYPGGGVREQCHQCGERGHFARDCKRKNEKPEHLVLTATVGDITFDEDMWMVYTAATYLKYFTSLDRTYRARVGMGNGTVVLAEGKGDVKITVKGVRMLIKNVLFVPGINRNVLSFGQMTERGYSMEMGGGECTIRDETGKVFANTRLEDRGIALRLKVIT